MAVNPYCAPSVAVARRIYIHVSSAVANSSLACHLMTRPFTPHCTMAIAGNSSLCSCGKRGNWYQAIYSLSGSTISDWAHSHLGQWLVNKHITFPAIPDRSTDNPNVGKHHTSVRAVGQCSGVSHSNVSTQLSSWPKRSPSSVTITLHHTAPTLNSGVWLSH